MPRHVIHRDEWDEFARRLERENDERIVAVHPWTSSDRYEVLTVKRHPDEVEQR